MRHRKYTFKIGRSSAHRKALLANQTCSLIIAPEIRTTLVKAKETRRVAEKMVTLAKKGTLHCRRQAISKLRNPDAVKILFDEIAPKYMNRQGGYTRIIQLGQRQGDGASTCILQWVEADSTDAKKSTKAKQTKKEVVKAEPKEAVVEEKITEEKAIESKEEGKTSE